MTVEKAYSLIFKTVRELGISDLAIIREIPSPSGTSPRKPSYVLLQYKKGLLGLDRRQIELSFGDKQTKTVVSLKWLYPAYEHQRKSSDGLTLALWNRKARQTEQDTVILVEELKSRIGAAEVDAYEEVIVKEIIKEKQVIVKVRCPYCANLYDEALDKCPHCGGRR
jgi:DNA-directed RNA polymerase subunit RPC12/RpoP